MTDINRVANAHVFWIVLAALLVWPVFLYTMTFAAPFSWLGTLLLVASLPIFWWIGGRLRRFRSRVEASHSGVLESHGVPLNGGVLRFRSLESLEAVTTDPAVLGDPELALDCRFVQSVVRGMRIGWIAMLVSTIILGLAMFWMAWKFPI